MKRNIVNIKYNDIRSIAKYISELREMVRDDFRSQSFYPTFYLRLNTIKLEVGKRTAFESVCNRLERSGYEIKR